MIEEQEIQARAGTPAAEAPVEAAPAEEAPAADLGKLKSFKNPAIQAVFAGQPAAVSTPVKNEDPAIKTAWDERDALSQAGIGFYKSLGGDVGVIFNALFLPEDQLKAADAAGQLLQVAPPYTDVAKSVTSAGPENHPLLNAQTPPAPPAASPPSPRQTGSGVLTPSAPKSTLRRLQSERVKALTPGGPTEFKHPIPLESKAPADSAGALSFITYRY